MKNGIAEIIASKQMPGITGTRDSFGIKNAFQDSETGLTIDNWKTWERAGFRKPLEVHKDSNVRAGIKRKIEKIKKYDGKQKVHFS